METPPRKRVHSRSLLLPLQDLAEGVPGEDVSVRPPVSEGAVAVVLDLRPVGAASADTVSVGVPVPRHHHGEGPLQGKH